MTAPTKVLVFSPVQTHPPHRGNRQRILQIAKLFTDSGYTVELAIGRNRKVTEEAKEFWADIHVLNRVPRWRPSRKNIPLDAWYTPGLGEEMAAIVEKTRAEIVVFNYVFHSKALDFLPPHITRVLDTHDVFSDRNLLFTARALSRGFFSCTEEDEATYLNRFDVVLAISESDKKTFERLVARGDVILLPFSSGVSTTVKQHASVSRKPQHFGAVLSSNDVNLTGLNDFVDAVTGQYGSGVPFTVTIAGDISKLAYVLHPLRYLIRRPRWLRFVGKIDNLDNFYDSIDAAVVPITSGTGMAVKFSEAISRGVPVISTLAGSRGHAVTHPHHSLPTNNELARVLGALSDSELDNLRESSRDLVKKNNERISRSTKKLFRLMNDLTSNTS